LGFFRHYHHIVGVHDHDSVRSRFPTLVPCSQLSIAGARAHRAAASGYCSQAATPRLPPALLNDRLFWVWLLSLLKTPSDLETLPALPRPRRPTDSQATIAAHWIIAADHPSHPLFGTTLSRFRVTRSGFDEPPGHASSINLSREMISDQ